MIYPVDRAIQLLNNWGLGLNPKEPYQSLDKGEGNFCVVFTYSIVERTHEIRNRATTAKKSKKCTKKGDARAKVFFFFANLNLLLFCRSRCRRRRCCLSSILRDPEILLLW